MELFFNYILMTVIKDMEEITQNDDDMEMADDELELFEEIEKEEEDEIMWHRLITSNPDMDWDGDYFFNEKYYE